MRRTIVLVLGLSLTSFSAIGAEETETTDKKEVQQVHEQATRVVVERAVEEMNEEQIKRQRAMMEARRQQEVGAGLSGHEKMLMNKQRLLEMVANRKAELARQTEERKQIAEKKARGELAERRVLEAAKQQRERAMDMGRAAVERNRDMAERMRDDMDRRRQVVERDSVVQIRAGERDRDPDMRLDQPRWRMSAELARFAQKEFPFIFEELKELSENPLRHGEEMEEIQNHLRGLIEMREENPEAYEREKIMMRLEHESHVVAEKVRTARNPKGKEELTQHLAKMLEELFEMKQQARHHEIEMMEKELQKRRKQFEMRQAHRSEIIRRHLGEMTGDHDLLGWE